MWPGGRVEFEVDALGVRVGFAAGGRDGFALGTANVDIYIYMYMHMHILCVYVYTYINPG